MEFVSQSIPDVWIIEPKVQGDERGYFTETYRQDKFEDALGYRVNFVQDNESKSYKGVLRGLHFQLAPCLKILVLGPDSCKWRGLI